jgi:hypothetical protein
MDEKYISNSFNGIRIGEKNGVTVFKIKKGFLFAQPFELPRLIKYPLPE